MFITYLQTESLIRIPDGPSVIVAKQNANVHARKAAILLAQDSIKNTLSKRARFWKMK
jgi:hypothetical protein